MTPGNKTDRLGCMALAEYADKGMLKPIAISSKEQEAKRSLLVEAAWRWRNKEPCAKRQYDKILTKAGIPQKAVVALARKLCIILLRIYMDLRPYRPANAANSKWIISLLQKP